MDVYASLCIQSTYPYKPPSPPLPPSQNKTPPSYLPGRFFGYLPFEGARFFAFLFYLLAFVVAFVRNRKDLLRLHWAIMLVRDCVRACWCVRA